MSAGLVAEFFVPPSRFGLPARQAVAARDLEVTFADGHTALCGTSGLWNVNLGYGNPAVHEAVAAALADASYLTLFRYGHAPAQAAAQALVDAAAPQDFRRVLFSTAGSAALDAAMKLCRQHSLLAGEARRQLVVSLRGSYHGMTFGAFSLTGEELGQQAYGIDRRSVRHVSPTDPTELARLDRSEGDRVAAVFLEPLLGSGAFGVSEAVLEAAFALRRRTGALIVADEVATGFWRTGPFMASSAWPEQPDLLICSKALTNGTCAASALLWGPRLVESFDRADAVLLHGETQAGTPASCAAILAVLDESRRLDVPGRAAALVPQLQRLLEGALAESALVRDLGGQGMFRALRLAHGDGSPLDGAQVNRVVDACLERGAIVQPGPSCIQLIPAAVYDEARLEDLVGRTLEGLAKAEPDLEPC